MELNLLKNNLSIRYYNNLSKVTKRLNIDNTFIKDEISKLKNVINELSSDIELKSLKNSLEDNQNNKPIYSDDYLYKKSWTKLSLVHKTIKMKEYVDCLLVENEHDKNQLKKKLVGLIKKKILSKKNKVNYDDGKGRIISIPDLVYQNGKYFIDL
jgi:hypothetical protein